MWRSKALEKKREQCSLIRDEWRIPDLDLSDQMDLTDIPRGGSLLTEDELRLTENYDASALANGIRTGDLTCEDITTAFCKVCITPKRYKVN